MKPIVFLAGLCSAVCCLPLASPAQTGSQGLVNYNHTYTSYIRSVQFHPAGDELGFPIIRLDGGQRLRLAFDDLEADVKDYTYSIVHCTKDWQPSTQISEMEYMRGFQEEIIVDYQFSIQTLTPYTHYELLIPNDRQGWKLSGNYLLHVFDSEGPPMPVITRRFVIVNNRVRIDAIQRVPNDVSKNDTHHEFDFTVDHQDFRIRNPLQELYAVVLQNGRWDNAVMSLRPFSTQGQSSLFDYQNKVIFPAGKEFRSLDMRSLLARSQAIAEIERTQTHFEVRLYPQLPRAQKVYLTRPDANGYFVVDNFDRNLDPTTAADYADVLFVLQTADGPLPGKDVYLFGALTEWEIKDEYRMRYNPNVNSYVVKALLKQGFYDYMYVAVDFNSDDPRPSLSELEGNWFETQNQYTILVYYRPFGGRYDQVIGETTFISGE